MSGAFTVDVHDYMGAWSISPESDLEDDLLSFLDIHDHDDGQHDA